MKTSLSASQFIAPLPFKDLLSGGEFDAASLGAVLSTASHVKSDVRAFAGALAGRVVCMMFEKPSLRTRVSFEAGTARLGGHAIYFDMAGTRLGERESVRDAAGTLERMVDMIVCRTHAHAPLAELARHSRVPVVNALCERFHPCQALADVMTIKEALGDVRGAKVVYLGDGNNVAHSLAIVASTLGADLTLVCPKGYALEAAVVGEAQARSTDSGGSVTVTDALDAVAGADILYADTWISMGDEAEKARRLKAFTPYQVNAAMMSRAGANARFMHCLPAKRGQEVTDDVIDSPASIVFDQAENRMHAQNALMLHMLCPGRDLHKTRTAAPPTSRPREVGAPLTH
ncbi:MAG: ornithine carbamoyltransferase [Phycisphaerales bacterium]